MNRKSNNDVTVTARYLADKGYTITRAAQNVGCSPSHLTMVLQGKRVPSEALLERLLAWLRVSFSPWNIPPAMGTLVVFLRLTPSGPVYWQNQYGDLAS